MKTRKYKGRKNQIHCDGLQYTRFGGRISFFRPCENEAVKFFQNLKSGLCMARCKEHLSILSIGSPVKELRKFDFLISKIHQN